MFWRFYSCYTYLPLEYISCYLFQIGSTLSTFWSFCKRVCYMMIWKLNGLWNKFSVKCSTIYGLSWVPRILSAALSRTRVFQWDSDRDFWDLSWDSNSCADEGSCPCTLHSAWFTHSNRLLFIRRIQYHSYWSVDVLFEIIYHAD